MAISSVSQAFVPPYDLGSAKSGAVARIAAGLLGFSIAAPILLIPGAIQSPRLTDLCLLLAAVVFAPGKAREVKLAAISALLIGGAWAFQLLASRGWPNIGETAFFSRWIVAVAAAPGVFGAFSRRPELFRLFLLGCVAGAALHVGTFFLSLAGFHDLLTSVGLASPRAVLSWSAHQTRYVTLSEHPNSAMALIALAVPCALSMRLGYRGAGLIVLAAALACMAFGFYYTLSRGAVLATGLAGLFYFRAKNDNSALFTPLFTIAAIAALVLGASALGVQFDGSRYAGRIAQSALSENLTGRLMTWWFGLVDAFKHPFGIGWTGYHESAPLWGLLRSTHNGYLFTARTVGLPFAALMLVGHVLAVVRGSNRVYAPLAAYFVGIMFVEDVTQGASLVFVAALMAAAGWLTSPDNAKLGQ